MRRLAAILAVQHEGIGMTRLVEALRSLELDGEIALGGRWVKLQGAHCPVYVVEAAWGAGYYTWCDDPEERAVQFYAGPAEAVQAGLRRAARRDGAGDDGDTFSA